MSPFVKGLSSYFVFIIIFCIDFMLDTERHHSIEFDVSLERSESSIFLHVKLTNKGIMPFPFYSGMLPWENYNIFQIVAIPFIQKDDQIVYQEIIKQHFIIADTTSSLKFIFLGKRLEGILHWVTVFRLKRWIYSNRKRSLYVGIIRFLNMEKSTFIGIKVM